MWLNGRASASQAEGCEFESRRPLHFYAGVAQVVEQLIRNQQIGVRVPRQLQPLLTGDLAQQVRALRSHRRGRRFESIVPTIFYNYGGIAQLGARLFACRRSGFESPISP